ncbi:MAG: molybdopterin molybdotransferase MoeA [Pyrinomonadaceae bacterium]
MISISKALKIVEKRIGKLSSEQTGLTEAVGRVLAENVYADMDLPPFDRSQMDGFAVRAKDVKDAPVSLKIIGESVAGKGSDEKLKRGETVRIMTGARVPKGADSVQKKELVNQPEDGQFAEITEATKAAQHIVFKAAEIEKGAKVFSKGEIINAQMIAVLASFGYARAEVYRKPRVSILATGSEIVPYSQVPQRDQIRDSNSISLKTFAENCGSATGVLPMVNDDLENLKQTIEKVANRSDILILSGGVSVGDYDFTKPALRELGAEIYFEKVALRPGKPTVFAKLNDCFIFGLPGNPVSVAVTFFLFARKAILQMQGADDCGLREGFAVLTKNMKGAKERDSYIPGKIDLKKSAQVSVEPVKWGGSSDFVSFSKADCLIFLPGDETIEADSVVKILYLPC